MSDVHSAKSSIVVTGQSNSHALELFKLKRQSFYSARYYCTRVRMNSSDQNRTPITLSPASAQNSETAQRTATINLFPRNAAHLTGYNGHLHL